MALLDVENLTIRFGARTVVDRLNLAIARGERFGIIGESGSGKSMTAMAIAGLLPDGAYMSGEVRVEGERLPRNERAMARLRGKRFGIVFQEPMTALNPLMRVGDQIGEAVQLGGAGMIEHEEVPYLLKEVGLEEKHAQRFPHQLSGGQRQRVMIAMALASRPDLLVADEPTSALDLVTQKRVLDLIGDICARRHMALLFISHDLKAVNALCTRVAVMHQGKIVDTGKVENVFSAPGHAYTQRLVAASHLDIAPAARPAMGAPLLELRALEREYRPGGLWSWGRRSTRAVNGVSLQVRQAECVALVGPSGCGKTTLARIIVGLDRATAGTMSFEGFRYHGDDLPMRQRKDLSLVFQDPFGSFDPRRRVGDSIAEPLRLEAGLKADERLRRVAEAVVAVGLHPDMLGRHPHEFSGGQRQRLAIARALVTRPKFLVLDEPVSALDVSVRGEVLALLARLQAEFGLTYLMISHDLDMVRAMADRVLVMEAGQIVEEGKPAEIFERPRHRLTQELVAARLPPVG